MGQVQRDMAVMREQEYECMVAVGKLVPALMGCLARVGANHWQRDGLRTFVALSACNDATVRAQCASGLAVVCEALGGRGVSTLVRIAEALRGDHDVQVRCAFAAALHRVLPPLVNQAPASSAAFRRMLQKLLEDSDRQVALALLDTLGAALKALGGARANSGGATGNGARAIDYRLCVGLADIAAAPDWRTRETVAVQLGLAAKSLTPRQQTDALLLLRALFRDATVPVRKAAGRSLVRVIRVVRCTSERCHQVSIFVNEFCNSDLTSYSTRVSMVDALYEALESYSSHSFAILYTPALLRLARDPVDNVRVKVVTRLHRAIRACRHDMVDGFEETLEALRRDSCLDVRERMRGFPHRAARVGASKRLQQRDARKLVFERWLYDDRFCLSDVKINANAGIAHQSPRTNAQATRPKQARPAKRALFHALSKVKRVLFPTWRTKRREEAAAAAGVMKSSQNMDEKEMQFGSCGSDKMEAACDEEGDRLFSEPHETHQEEEEEDEEREREREEKIEEENGTVGRDENMSDQLEVLSLSSASFGEATPQWRLSSDGAWATRSASASASASVWDFTETETEGDEFDAPEQPLSLPVRAAAAAVCKTRRSSPTSVTSFQSD